MVLIYQSKFIIIKLHQNKIIWIDKMNSKFYKKFFFDYIISFFF